jgi:hypothetical protein
VKSKFEIVRLLLENQCISSVGHCRDSAVVYLRFFLSPFRFEAAVVKSLLIDDRLPSLTSTQVSSLCILLYTFSTTAMHVINNNSVILQRRRSKSSVNTTQRSSSHQELHRFLLTGQLYESANCTIAVNTQQHHQQDRDLQSTSFQVP